MSRLIDADKIEPHERMDSFGGQYESVMVAYMDDIDALPTVDAVPVRHGRWKEDKGGYGFWVCSYCNFVSEASGANILYKFCPNCGADMRKDGDNG